jgi:hypothetical protein
MVAGGWWSEGSEAGALRKVATFPPGYPLSLFTALHMSHKYFRKLNLKPCLIGRITGSRVLATNGIFCKV